MGYLKADRKLAVQQGMDSETSFGNNITQPTNEDGGRLIRQRTDSLDCGSLSTASMVTVRLSDATISPSMIDTSTDKEDVVEEQNYKDEGALEAEDLAMDRDRTSVAFSEDLNYMERADRASTASMASILEERTLGSTSGTLRSRSDSSGTLSSAGSAQVDWEELEKSEEQEPRDEGSDEVIPKKLSVAL